MFTNHRASHDNPDLYQTCLTWTRRQWKERRALPCMQVLERIGTSSGAGQDCATSWHRVISAKADKQ